MLNPHLTVDDVLDRINDLDFEAVVLGQTQNETLLRLLLTALEFMLIYPTTDTMRTRRIEVIDTVMTLEKAKVFKEHLYRLLIGDAVGTDRESALLASRDQMGAFLGDFIRTRHYQLSFYEDHPTLHLRHGELDFLTDEDTDDTVVPLHRRKPQRSVLDEVPPKLILGDNTALADTELVMRLWLNELSIDVPSQFYDTMLNRRRSTAIGVRHLHRLPVNDRQMSWLRNQWYTDILDKMTQTELNLTQLEFTRTIDYATVARALGRRDEPTDSNE